MGYSASSCKTTKGNSVKKLWYIPGFLPPRLKKRNGRCGGSLERKTHRNCSQPMRLNCSFCVFYSTLTQDQSGVFISCLFPSACVQILVPLQIKRAGSFEPALFWFPRRGFIADRKAFSTEVQRLNPAPNPGNIPRRSPSLLSAWRRLRQEGSEPEYWESPSIR